MRALGVAGLAAEPADRDFLRATLSRMDTTPDKPDWGPHHTALGALVVEWSKIEMLLAQLFENLAGIDTFLASLLTDRTNPDTLIKHCRVLLLGFDKESDQQLVTEWVDRADRLRVARNKMIHSQWVNQLAGGGAVIARMETTVDRKAAEAAPIITPTTSREVDAVTSEINQLVKDFGTLPVRADVRPRIGFLPPKT